MGNNEEIREHIRKNYANIAIKGVKGGDCACGSGCCNDNAMDIKGNTINLGYSEEDLLGVPIEANMGLGCGNPIAIAALKEVETVLDLGSGGGFDCFLARRQVGEMGYVIGVDMTPEMIKLSRNNLRKSGYTNMEFRLGEIENLPVADASIDVIISNCVINLSLEKEKVFKEAYRVLKSGGRLSISDVVATAELPHHVKDDLSMMAGCIAGAEYIENIRGMLLSVGFSNVEMIPKDNSREILKSWAPGKNIEEFVASYIIEAKKK
ncbi:arsenite methyltransferase [Clostridium algoriphilum]|uniref:arsenite methyltransferase n=1 Tax=Clostridium algoriphilum TaxID=198347 RepID=UPI001CF43C05|nr:arsenite methyltransferase [Clostridium algoriphilum]MCB2294532.1 arsenite methyltransferase [Clostridium algoriphilum]